MDAIPRYTHGRTTRSYPPSELALHRERTIELVRKEAQWAPGTPSWNQDREVILFYAQCLDRPAFRTHFHEEMSFSAFDRAMEANGRYPSCAEHWLLADTRRGAVIDRAKGKSYVVHSVWREKLDQIAKVIEKIREKFPEAVGFNEMLHRLRHESRHRMNHENGDDDAAAISARSATRGLDG
jgi:hypothetical protein